MVEGNNYRYDAMLFINKVKSQDNSYMESINLKLTMYVVNAIFFFCFLSFVIVLRVLVNAIFYDSDSSIREFYEI